MAPGGSKILKSISRNQKSVIQILADVQPEMNFVEPSCATDITDHNQSPQLES